MKLGTWCVMVLLLPVRAHGVRLALFCPNLMAPFGSVPPFALRKICCAMFQILSAPNFALSFTLQVDASARGAGAVLMQTDDAGIEHPISYFSKKFTKCQQNYSDIEKEALALLLALQHFELYLSSGNRIVVYTDHNPLTFLSHMPNSN